MRTYIVTPAAGKRLIGMALARHPAVLEALRSKTVVIVAGTTNGYVAEEILNTLGDTQGFSRRRFYRGITLPPAAPGTGDRAADTEPFPGDVVLVKGNWHRGKVLADVVDSLNEGDLILKGANAVDVEAGRAAVLIGDTKGGTAALAVQAVVGRRVRLIVPVGLEKRVSGPVEELAAKLNCPGAIGPRMLPLPGEVFTELEAIRILSGASARLLAAGGVGGAEGCVWLCIEGTPEQEEAASRILESIAAEPPFGG